MGNIIHPDQSDGYPMVVKMNLTTESASWNLYLRESFGIEFQ